MNILTIAVIIIFMIFMVIGYKRGLFRSVFKIILTGLSFVLAYFFAPLVSTFLINNTNIDDYINQRIDNFIESKIKEQVREQVSKQTGELTASVDNDTVNQMVDQIMSSELTRNEQIDFIYDLELPDFISDALLENNNENVMDSLGVNAFFDYIASYVTRMIMNGMAFVIISFVFWLVSNIILMVASFAVQLPIVSSINRVGGIIFGGAEALLIVWAVFVVISVIAQTSVGNELYNQITENAILKFLYDKNIFLPIITGMNSAINITL